MQGQGGIKKTMSDCGLKNEVERDVCEFYGASHEQYDNIVRGIGITDALKKYGIEIDEVKKIKQENQGARRYKKENNRK